MGRKYKTAFSEKMIFNQLNATKNASVTAIQSKSLKGHHLANRNKLKKSIITDIRKMQTSLSLDNYKVFSFDPEVK